MYLGQISDLLRWVLTRADLSDMNILVAPECGHVTGVVDWADATIEPFGVNLLGLENALGCNSNGGWSYFERNTSRLRLLFWKVFLTGIGKPISEETRNAIDAARCLGFCSDTASAGKVA